MASLFKLSIRCVRKLARFYKVMFVVVITPGDAVSPSSDMAFQWVTGAFVTVGARGSVYAAKDQRSVSARIRHSNEE